MRKRWLAVLACAALLLNVVPPPAHADGTLPKDARGHWAAGTIAKWTELGLLTGYPDGTVRPDRPLTRAEFVRIVNTLFGLSAGTGGGSGTGSGGGSSADSGASLGAGLDTTFADVAPDAWYAADVAAARKAGYIEGYPDGRFLPDRPISREEAAHILARLFRLNAVSDAKTALGAFADAGDVAAYAASALAAMAEKGYLQGFSDRTLRPKQPLTRAEAVALVDRIVPNVLNRSGVYGPIETDGRVLVNTGGVTLRDAVVNGDVLLTTGVGDGDVVLDGVRIGGTLWIEGGGEHSVRLLRSTVRSVVIARKEAAVRFVVGDGTSVDAVRVETKATVEVSGDGKVEEMRIMSGAKGTSVSAVGEIRRLVNEADEVVVNGARTGKGTIGSVAGGRPPASSAGDSTDVATPGGGSSGGSGGSGQPMWTLVWADEFDGTASRPDANGVDLDKWGYQLGTGSQYGLVDWGNNEQQYYRAENAYVQDGKLIIEARNDGFGGKPYTSARLFTQPTFSKKYGKFEARIRMPKGQGFWPAFWLMPKDSIYGGWAASGEIDIMEARGRLPGEVSGTIHFGGTWPNNKSSGATYRFPEGTDIGDFHVYSLEWEPGELRWYVDGQLYQTLNNWDSIGPGQPAKYAYPAPFDQPFYIILNLAVGGNFDGGRVPDASMFPARMEVDYVRVYELTGRPYRTPTEPVIAPEPLPANAKQPVDGNLVYDARYERGFTEITAPDTPLNTQYWNFVHINTFGGAGTVAVESVGGVPFAKINVTSPGNAVHAVQLIQNVTLGKGRWYRLTFDAKASADRSISVKFGGGAERGWTTYSDVWDIPLSTQLQRYEKVFQMTRDTDVLARLEFNVGLNTAGVWIGNVRVTETTAPDPYPDGPKTPLADGNHVYNGTFDLGRMDRMTYWHFATNGADASASVDPDARELAVAIRDAGTSPEAIALGQPGIQLLQNNAYRLTFKARSDRPRSIRVALRNADGSVEYAAPVAVPLTTAMETKTVDFAMNAPSDANGRLVFLFGGEAGNVYLDDVKLVRTTNNIDLTGVSVFPLVNGDFALGLEAWKTYAIDGGAATFSADGGEAHVAIAGAGPQPWSVMLNQENMRFTGGITYVLSFKARSSVPRTIEAVVDDPNYKRFLSQSVQLTPEMQTFTYEFQPATNQTLSLKFLLGQPSGASPLGAHDIWIDDVVLEMKDAPVMRPPYLRADPARNAVGGPMVVSFADDPAWRAAVRSVTVNGQALSAGQYTLEAGRLTITGDVFAAAGPYTIVVSAQGYADASVTDTVVADSGNLVVNGDFAAGTSGWGFWAGEGGAASVSVRDGAAAVDIASIGTFNWSVQFFQENIMVEAGKTYELTFRAWSTVNRPIRLEYTGRPTPERKFDITADSAVVYRDQFVASASGALKLNFCIGNVDFNGRTTPTVTHTVYFDDVVLREVVEPAVDNNPITDARFTNDLSGWRVHNQGDFEQWAGKALFIAENGEVKATVIQPGWEAWHIQFYKDGVQLTAGTYRLTFDMRGDVERPVLVELSQNNVPVDSKTVNVLTTAQTFEVLLSVPADGAYKLMFGFGRKAAAGDPNPQTPYNLYLDNVRLVPAP